MPRWATAIQWMWGCCCITGKKCIPCSCIQMDVIPSPSLPSSWSVLFGSILLQIKRRAKGLKPWCTLFMAICPPSPSVGCATKGLRKYSATKQKRGSKATLLHPPTPRWSNQLATKNLLMTEISAFSADDEIALNQGLFCWLALTLDSTHAP